jgi:hypothetical protein
VTQHGKHTDWEPCAYALDDSLLALGKPLLALGEPLLALGEPLLALGEPLLALGELLLVQDGSLLRLAWQTGHAMRLLLRLAWQTGHAMRLLLRLAWQMGAAAALHAGGRLLVTAEGPHATCSQQSVLAACAWAIGRSPVGQVLDLAQQNRLARGACEPLHPSLPPWLFSSAESVCAPSQRGWRCDWLVSRSCCGAIAAPAAVRLPLQLMGLAENCWLWKHCQQVLPALLRP